jgi:hypothetical protein
MKRRGREVFTVLVKRFLTNGLVSPYPFPYFYSTGLFHLFMTSNPTVGVIDRVRAL